jgi:hypothetical protein
MSSRSEAKPFKLPRRSSEATAIAAALLLAACGSASENVSTDVVTSTGAAKSAPRHPDAKPVVDKAPETHSAKNPDGNVSAMIDSMIEAGFTGGDGVTVFKEKTAGEAIIARAKQVADEALPEGVSIDELEEVIEHGSPQQVDIMKKSPGSPEELEADSPVHFGDQLSYHFNDVADDVH